MSWPLDRVEQVLLALAAELRLGDAEAWHGNVAPPWAVLGAHYSTQAMIDPYEALYRDVLAGRAPAPGEEALVAVSRP